MSHAVKILVEDDELHKSLEKFAREIFLSVGRAQIASILEQEISRICEKDYVKRIAPQLSRLNAQVLQAEIMKYFRENTDLKKEMKETIVSRIDAADFGVNLLALIDKRARELTQNEYKGALIELAEKQAELNDTCAAAMRMLDEVRSMKVNKECACKLKAKKRKEKSDGGFAAHMGH